MSESELIFEKSKSLLNDSISEIEKQEKIRTQNFNSESEFLLRIARRGANCILSKLENTPYYESLNISVKEYLQRVSDIYSNSKIK